jgi:hypothetical protein
MASPCRVAAANPMIQFVLSGTMPQSPRLRQRCLYNPDVLLALGERAGQGHPQSGETADRFSAVLHDLRMAGAWKRTNRRRLQRTEAMLCAHIGPALRGDLTFLDIGASDGVTTIEAVHALRQAFGLAVRAYVADLNLWLLRYRYGPIVEYRAGDGEPIMVRIGCVGIRLARSRRGAARPDYNPLAQLYLRCRRLRRAMRQDAAISLVNPLARGEPGVEVIELDCLRRDEGLVGRFAAVRASNVLNLGYFDPPRISQAIGHLHAYLRDGGCLVVSRNADGPAGETENGSVWRRTAERFRWVEDFGAGSEVKALVDDWRANRPSRDAGAGNIVPAPALGTQFRQGRG